MVIVVGVLVAALWLHTLATACCLWPPFDRWAQRQPLGRRPVRSFLPFWGLFAQDGMFDVDICHRTVRGTGDVTPWRRLTPNDRSWSSWLWRPASRDDRCAFVLARQMLAGGRDRASRPAYDRITGRVREATGPEGHEAFQWCVQISRGYWSASQPTIVFLSRIEPGERTGLVGRP